MYYQEEEDPLKQMLGNEFIWYNSQEDYDYRYVACATKFIGVYFADANSPASKKFTPILRQFYNESNAGEKKIEIIFVSYDQSYKSFDKNLSQMPWIAVPYGDKR